MTASSPTFGSQILTDIGVVCLLAVLAVVMAWVRATTMSKVQPTSGTIQKISLSEAQMRMAEGAIFIDARPGPFYEFGHIPTAISVPKITFEASWEKLSPKPLLEALIVVYCSGESCEDSMEVVLKLHALGYRKAMVFEGGYDAWETAGLPVISKEGTP